MNTVIVLGADRVGKSTLISRTEKLIDESNCCSYKTLHFSEVKPYHNSPIEQFLIKLDEVKAEGKPDLLLCDRFSPDTIFYEQHRHQTGAHDVELSRMVESKYISESSDISMLYLCRPWNDEMEARHEEELMGMGGSAWWIRKMLEVRREEHYGYQSFIQNYLDKMTLLDKSRIIEIRDAFPNTIFQYMPDLLNSL